MWSALPPTHPRFHSSFWFFLWLDLQVRRHFVFHPFSNCQQVIFRMLKWCGLIFSPGEYGFSSSLERPEHGNQKRWWGKRRPRKPQWWQTKGDRVRLEVPWTWRERHFLADETEGVRPRPRRSGCFQLLTLAWTVERTGCHYMGLGGQSQAHCCMLLCLLNIQGEMLHRRLSVWIWTLEDGFHLQLCCPIGQPLSTHGYLSLDLN